MQDFDAGNSIRLIAADVVHKLFVAKDVTQLELLRAQIDGSLRHLRGENTPAASDGEYSGIR